MMECQWLTPVRDSDPPEFIECHETATFSRTVPVAYGAAASINLCTKHKGEHDGRVATHQRARRKGRR